MLTGNAELSVLQGVLQFISYMGLAVFADNMVFSRALGVTRLLKLLPDQKTKAWPFCLPLVMVQVLSAPLGWAVHNRVSPLIRENLPDFLPFAALRPLIFLTCAMVAMAIAWLLLFILPRKQRKACQSQLSVVACSCSVMGTLLICANQNYTLWQSLGFGLGSGLGYVFAVFIIREGRRRLRSKAVPVIFKGLPSTLIYIGIFSLALYGLLGHTNVM